MAPEPTLDKNQLFYGDNLQVLREHIPSDSVDLIYLDPPFNSRQDYNVLFAEKDGSRSPSQITAFKDSWEWNLEAEHAYQEVVEAGGRVADAMRAFRTLLGGTDMLAYLAMMAPRLIELRRVLKPTGSIYLHCDPTASHYLKLLMDSIFGAQMFKTEIIWKRSSAHSDGKQGRKQHGRIHDVILFYTESETWIWNPVYTIYDKEYISKFYRHVEDETGRRYTLGDLSGPGGAAKGNPAFEILGVTRHWRFSQAKVLKMLEDGRIVQSAPGKVPRYKRYLDEMSGVALQDVWTDIPPIGAQARERLGYPTQKPEALLERILLTSSKDGDVILDPFCGCGTTIQVAQKLKRRWRGIDITHLAIGLIKYRLDDSFGPDIRRTYQVIGEPKDFAGAVQLASENKDQFQNWALGLCGGRRAEGIKKGADRGIDGRVYFFEANSPDEKQIIFSVKGGMNIGVSEIRDLIGVLQREQADFGVYISLAEPTKPMQREAAEAGFYTSLDGSKYPRVQLLTITGLMNKTQSLQRPYHVRDATFRKAPRFLEKAAQTMKLPLT